MRNGTRRITTGLAAAALTIGVIAGSGQAAQAADWDGTVTMSAAEVQDKHAMQKGAAKLTCLMFTGPMRTVCGIAGQASMNSHIEDAAAKGCGITMRWRATGSGMSYDKAEYAYSQNC